MKIRNKIALIFVVLTAFLLFTVFVYIYVSTKQYTASEFYLRLNKRASIAAQSYLEEDELSTAIYAEIRRKHLQILPNEEEHIYTVKRAKNSLAPSNIAPLTRAFFDEVLENNQANTQIGDKYYTGLFYPDNQGDFIVVLSAEDLYGQAKMDNLRRTMVTAFILSLIILFVIGQYYAKQVLKPIMDIIQKVNLIRVRNLHLRLDQIQTKDELAELVQTFNNMLDRLETSFQMQRSFIHNASHELKNPLTAIIGQSEVALNGTRGTEEYIKTLRAIEQEALHLGNLVNSLLEMADLDRDSQGLALEHIGADELLIELCRGLDANSAQRINFNFDYSSPSPNSLIFQGNHGLIRVAILNVLDNALKYSQPGTIDLNLKITDRDILISVGDHGIGIPKDELQNICEPFYRGSNARAFKGFGFGLPLSHKIVGLHGGELKIVSHVDKGTLVTIVLPNLNKNVKIAR